MIQHAQKELFNLSPEVTYLNCAYMSPLLRKVEEVGHKAIAKKSNPQQIFPEDFFTDVQALKEAFARLIDLEDWERIAIIPSASYGLSTVAHNLKLQAGQKIIVVEEQFPSNYYPWQRAAESCGAQIVTVGPDPQKDRTRSWNENILAAIDEQTALVAVGHCHWADGTFFDLVRISARTREVGALLIVDGTQSVGALPFSVKEIQPDALICAGYKWLMGPYSTGVAYYGPYFDGGKPLEDNWINRLESEKFSGLVNYQVEYKSKAARYSVGESSNFILTPMLAEAIRQVNDWGAENIQAYCKRISAAFAREVKKLGFTVEKEEHRCGHLFGIRLSAEVDIEALKYSLRQKKIFVSFRGTAIRISPHVYNTAADFEHLLQCLRQVAEK